MRAAQLSWTRDRDHVWGPFLYAKDKSFSAIMFMACSGRDPDDCDGQRASLLMKWGLHTLIVALPHWLVPTERKKVYPGPESWGPEVVARLGRDWYWQHTRREFGFSICDGHLSVRFGRQTDSWPGDKSWSCFLPWTQWRHVRLSYYGPDHEHLRAFIDRHYVSMWLRRRLKNGRPPEGFGRSYKMQRAFEESMPKAGFAFRDYDGEALVVRTHIEEREWRFGTGLFMWLSWFCAPKISRSLHLEFSGETGSRKGSWKGGTLGHGIDIAVGETPEAAFRRYCLAHDMTFVGPVDAATLAQAFACRDRPSAESPKAEAGA